MKLRCLSGFMLAGVFLTLNLAQASDSAQLQSQDSIRSDSSSFQLLQPQNLFFGVQYKSLFSGNLDGSNGANGFHVGATWMLAPVRVLGSLEYNRNSWSGNWDEFRMEGLRETAVWMMQVFSPESGVQHHRGYAFGIYVGASRIKTSSHLSGLWSQGIVSSWLPVLGLRASYLMSSSRKWGWMWSAFIESGYFASAPESAVTNLGLTLAFNFQRSRNSDPR